MKIQLRNPARRDADAVNEAEGSIRTIALQGRSGVAGVPSSGHASKGIPHEPRRARHLRSRER